MNQKTKKLIFSVLKIFIVIILIFSFSVSGAAGGAILGYFKIIETSQSRKEPFCDVYKRCGGCSLQHMDYQAQLDFKENVVRENLRRIGGLEIDGAEGAKIHKTIGMEDPFRYRNKAQFPVAYTGKEIVTGFYAKRSHEVVDSSSCAIQDPLADKTRLLVKKFIKEKGLSVYDELSGKGLIRHIMTRTAFQSGELMVVLVINGDELHMLGYTEYWYNLGFEDIATRIERLIKDFEAFLDTRDAEATKAIITLLG
jgi:tRNA/tmRNA/rRNA uracil-C5-methylase (TrmA/RlmC/RlmD family)